MKKDVLISIKGIYLVEDERDEIELFTTGQLYKKDGDYYISYQETEATGYAGSHTTLHVQQDRITLHREGAANAQLIVEQGVRHQCHYGLDSGEMMIGVLGGQIRSTLTDAGGNVEFTYSLDVNSMLASENAMYVNVKECAN